MTTPGATGGQAASGTRRQRLTRTVASGAR